jgi:hypothetical protein
MEVQDIEVPGRQFLHMLISAEGEESSIEAESQPDLAV